MSPPTFRSPWIPTPPATFKAPVVLLIDGVVPTILTESKVVSEAKMLPHLLLELPIVLPEC